ncbi:MAG: AEC family transporter [Leptothrix sp. (in: b-proteobacteria)]
MPVILGVTGPIYLLILAGYLSVRFGLFAKADMRVLGRFVAQFALPALLFRALSQRSLGEIVNVSYLVAYALGSLLALFAGYLIARHVQKKPLSLSGLVGMGMACSNSGFIGAPIVAQLLGPVAGVALALTMLVENLLTIPLALLLADQTGQGGQSWQQVLRDTGRKLAGNPLIIAIVLGLLTALLQPPLPEIVTRSIALVAAASSPVALFVIGGTLVGLQVRGLLGDVALIAAGKLLLHPLAVLGLLWLLPPLDPALRTAAVVFAAMPMFSIYPVLAQKYHHEGFCAAALLATTVTAFGSISALLWLLQQLPGWHGA